MAALNAFEAHIREEVLAIRLQPEMGTVSADSETSWETEVDGNKLWVAMERQAAD